MKNRFYEFADNHMTINTGTIAKEVSLFIAVPSYKETKSEFTQSLCELTGFLSAHRIQHKVHFHRGDSVPDLARNLCVANFLLSPCTHLFFVDDDLHFRKDDVLRMIAMDVDVISGSYAMKYLFFEQLREKIIATTDFATMDKQDAINLLITGGIEMTAKPTKDGKTMHGAREADRIPGGFCVIKKAVFQRIIQMHPELHFETGNKDDVNPWLYQFYKHRVVDERWVGEDFSFSDLCRQCGITLWQDTEAVLSHIGSFAFTGDPKACTKS